MKDNERKSPDRYLKWAHAFVVVYSITSRASYDEARSYLDIIAQYQRITGKDIPVAVVGNKMDLERYRLGSAFNGSTVAHSHSHHIGLVVKTLDSQLSVAGSIPGHDTARFFLK